MLCIQTPTVPDQIHFCYEPENLQRTYAKRTVNRNVRHRIDQAAYHKMNRPPETARLPVAGYFEIDPIFMPHPSEPLSDRERTRAFQPLSDYALIGDCGSAALISKDGSIDWLCWPKFDSSSIFAAILDRKKGGFFQIVPSGPFDVERRYVGDTNVLETTFRTATGTVRLTDLMTVADADVYNEELWPDHEVLRKIECTEGTVQVKIICDPRPHYGERNPRLESRGRLGYFYNDRTHVYVVRSDFAMNLFGNDHILSATLTLSEGDRRHVSFSYDAEEPAVLPLLGDHAQDRIDRSIEYWRSWSGRCPYEGPFRDAVVRSALTLKLMTYSRSGAVIAAPTTSLPEHIGGERNWDYRYCWLRDASLTLRALFELGYKEEGEAFFSWLLYTTRQQAPELNVLYSVYGEREIEERVLDHLEGYRGSRPVRIGNEARIQLQLDTYGDLISAAFEYVRHVGDLDRWQIKLLVQLGKVVCRRWNEPDHGIWEIRSEPRHHTYSKVMCWVALDRLLKLQESGHLEVPTDLFEKNKAAIEEAVEARGFNKDLNSYVAVLDGDEVDASLLLLPLYGYVDVNSERMRSTFELVQDRLAIDSLMYRYPHHTEDGLPPGEGAFGLSSFWDEEILAHSGRLQEAKQHFEKMLGYANDVGLFAEEIDPDTGEALGNFPQAFTHIGLINAALTIADIEGRQKASHLEEDVEDKKES